jgi:hypothetical protein
MAGRIAVIGTARTGGCGLALLPLVAAILLVAMGADAKVFLTIEPDTAIRVTGQGCGPHAKVGVVLGASHASGHTLATFPADRRGRFSRVVAVPFAGERTAEIMALCDNAAGNNSITAFDAVITYRHTPAERARVTK